jgi:hypothetical protein
VRAAPKTVENFMVDCGTVDVEGEMAASRHRQCCERVDALYTFVFRPVCEIDCFVGADHGVGIAWILDIKQITRWLVMFQCAECGRRILDLDCSLNASARDAAVTRGKDAISINVINSIQIQKQVFVPSWCQSKS